LKLFRNELEFKCLNSFKKLENLTLTKLAVQPVEKISLGSLRSLNFSDIEIYPKSMECIFQEVGMKLVHLKIKNVVMEHKPINVVFQCLETFSLGCRFANNEYIYEQMMNAICGSVQTLKYLKIQPKESRFQICAKKLELFTGLEKLKYHNSSDLVKVHKNFKLNNIF
jgi:hypothetical protein